jgi:two-component system, LytTR family, response regulator
VVNLDLEVLIADDDEGIRLVLKKIVEKQDGFELVGEAPDGEKALALVEATKPNVVFLDVEMPNMTGIECAKKIQDINPKIFIIFATAHEEYMPAAFEVYASDYITKPFKIERLIQTLDRIKTLHNQQDVMTLTSIMRHEKGLDKLLIKNKEGISFVDMEDILLIQREDRSTVVYTSDDRYVTSDGLSELEERLDKTVFFRSHKSYIINLSMVHKIYPYGRWTYIIKLKNTDKDALLTHEKFEEMEKLFSS